MIRSLAAAGAVAMILAGGPASIEPAAAQQTGVSRGDGADRAAKRFKRFDRNGDGAIDRAELEQRMLRVFRKLDRNEDGAIDRDEMQNAKSGRRGGKEGKNPDRMAKRLGRLDADKDGRVTEREYLAKMPKWFRRGDADRDGRVTRQEFEDFMADSADKRARWAERKKDDM